MILITLLYGTKFKKITEPGNEKYSFPQKYINAESNRTPESVLKVTKMITIKEPNIWKKSFWKSVSFIDKDSRIYKLLIVQELINIKSLAVLNNSLASY